MKIVKRFGCTGKFAEDYCPDCGTLMTIVHKQVKPGHIRIYVKCFSCKKETLRAQSVETVPLQPLLNTKDTKGGNILIL